MVEGIDIVSLRSSPSPYAESSSFGLVSVFTQSVKFLLNDANYRLTWAVTTGLTWCALDDGPSVNSCPALVGDLTAGSTGGSDAGIVIVGAEVVSRLGAGGFAAVAASGSIAFSAPVMMDWKRAGGCKLNGSFPYGF